MSKDGGSAFPLPRVWDSALRCYADCYTNPGMTLRDYFAAAALQGWLATYGPDQPSGSVALTDNAMLAYKQADAMLAERDK